MIQKWEDEGERQKILIEKHARGSAARLKRRMERQTRYLNFYQKVVKKMGSFYYNTSSCMLGQQEMNTRMERKTRKAEDVCALPMWSRKTRLTSNQDISSFTMPHQQAQNLLTFIIPTVQLGRATTSNVWMISLFRQTRILGLVIVQFGAQLGRDTMNGMRIFLGLEALSEGVVQQAHNLWTFIILTVQLGRATTSNV